VALSAVAGSGVELVASHLSSFGPSPTIGKEIARYVLLGGPKVAKKKAKKKVAKKVVKKVAKKKVAKKKARC
jgi:hypothetical protein